MPKDLKRHFPATIVMIVILLLGSYYLFSKSMTTYPSFIHAWTQTDRLALAMNFQENGFDFFHPATYNLKTKDGVTQVDFPIHDYLVAAIGSVFNIDLVPTFRYYNLIYSLIGLFFFYRLCLLYTHSGRRAIFAGTFVFTLPVLVYYQNGFLPSLPSFSNFIIGLFAFALYQKTKKRKHFFWTVFFLSLAALSRSPYFIFLFALLLHRIIIQIQQKRLIKSEIFYCLGGIILLIGYFFYNQSLADEYGSMFLSQLLYIDSFATFTTIIDTAVDRFGSEYLSPYHGILLLALLLAVFWQLKNKLTIGIAWMESALYFIISCMGVGLFFLLMGKQFIDHDYYVIDSFYPLLILFLPLALSIINIPKRWYTPTVVICGLFFFYFFTYASETQAERYTPKYNDRSNYAYHSYKNALQDFKNWGIEKSDTIMVLDAVSTNMPFTIWGNRGYTNLNTGRDSVKAALKKDFTYLALLDSNFVTDAYKDYPGIIKRLKLLHSNGELSLYQKTKERNPANFFKQLHYYGELDFDEQSSLDSATMENVQSTFIGSDFGNSLSIPFDQPYALSINIDLKTISKNLDLEVLILADYQPISDTAQIQLICQHEDHYQVEYLENFITKVNQWQNKLFRFRLPYEVLKQNEPLTVYFWNPEQDNLYIDNYKILIYQ